MGKVDKFHSWARHGLQKFCDYTSVHGYYELYHAKNCFWFLFWMSICCGSFVVTVYQVYSSAAQYMASSTITTMVPAQEDDIQYPVFSLCLFHWYYWVDWNKAMSLNVSKEVLLYGFSFYNFIFYSSKFDVDETQVEFMSMMKANNFNTLSDFYYYISRDVPRIINDNGAKVYFDMKQVVYSVKFNMFCYQIGPENMKRMFNRSHTAGSALKPKVIQFDIPDETYKNYNQWVTIEEHKQYVTRFMQNFTAYQIDTDNLASDKENFSTFVAPKIVVPTGDVAQGTRILPDNDAYFLTLRASAYTWQNIADKPCNETIKALSSDLSCRNLCELDYQMQSCSCLVFEVAIRGRHDTIDHVCQRGFLLRDVVNNDTINYVSLSVTAQNCSNDTKLLNDYYFCTNKCVPACQIWTYEQTLSVTTTSPTLRKVGKKNSTTVRVEFPMGKDCIIMSDADAQTWEGFVANVGGLLGIWTGASVISIIQFIYLCCFNNDYWSFCRGHKKKRKIKRAPQTINVIQTAKTKCTDVIVDG